MLNTKKRAILYLQLTLPEIPHNVLLMVRTMIEKYKTDRLSDYFIADNRKGRN